MYKKRSAFRFKIRCHTLLKDIFYKIASKKEINDIQTESKVSKYLMNYKFDATNPRTFNEYTVWMKYNYRNDLWKKAADKLEGKEYLKKAGYEKYLPKVFGIYNSSSEIDLDKLPEKFVLKTNHDSGSVFVCEKNKTDFKIVFEKLDKSLQKKYSSANEEWVYEDIKPLIFAEEFLNQVGGGEIIDYKLFVYNGKFKWGFACLNRSVDSHFLVFEDNFEIQDTDYIYIRPKKKDYPNKPKEFDLMVKLAEEIGKEFPFVRVDFFDTTDGIKVGELTFFTQAGKGPFSKKKYDFKYGKYFEDTIFYKLAHPNE